MQLFLITVSVLVVSVNAVLYADCGSKLVTVQKVSVSGCAEDANVCELERNTNATFSIDFTPNKEMKQVVAAVVGDILGVPVPFPLSQPDACKDSGLTCPLPADQLANYQTTMPILKSYPRFKFKLNWNLIDRGSEDIISVCIDLTVKIQ